MWADGDSAAIARIDAKDLAVLADLGAPSAEAMTWLRCDLHECGGCGKTNTLTVQRVELSIERGGKTKQDCKTIVERLLITREEAIQIRSLPATLGPAAPEPVAESQ